VDLEDSELQTIETLHDCVLQFNEKIVKLLNRDSLILYKDEKVIQKE
jgi:hypothetical protein